MGGWMGGGLGFDEFVFGRVSFGWHVGGGIGKWLIAESWIAGYEMGNSGKVWIGYKGPRCGDFYSGRTVGGT